MRRKMLLLISIMFVIGLSATSALAGDVHFNGAVLFGLNFGSSTASASTILANTTTNTSLDLLKASGTLVGIGSTDVVVSLQGQGFPVVTCSNQGTNQSPGQNPPKISASGQQLLNSKLVGKNGMSPFGVITNPPDVQALTAVQLGCPNDNWTATISFVNYTDATIQVISTKTGAVLLEQNYTCTTAQNSVMCTPQ